MSSPRRSLPAVRLPTKAATHSYDEEEDEPAAAPPAPSRVRVTKVLSPQRSPPTMPAKSNVTYINEAGKPFAAAPPTPAPRPVKARAAPAPIPPPAPKRVPVAAPLPHPLPRTKAAPPPPAPVPAAVPAVLPPMLAATTGVRSSKRSNKRMAEAGELPNKRMKTTNLTSFIPKPKRAPSAYDIFVKENYQELKKRPGNENKTFSEMSRILSDAWKKEHKAV